MAYLPNIIDRNLSNFNPARSVAKMQRRMDRLFDRMLSDVGADDFDLRPSIDLIPANSFTFAPSCNVDETDSHYLISFDIPGVKKEDVKVDLIGNTLTVSGERKEEFEKKGKNKYRSESSYGSFFRSFDLTDEVKADQIEAQFDNGVLKVAVPKIKASKSESIKISEGKGSGLWGKLIGQKKEENKGQH